MPPGGAPLPANDWQTMLLVRLKAPEDLDLYHALTWWAASEGMPDWTNNPLATEREAPGSRNWNKNGVQIYPTRKVGVEATYDTMTNGNYPGILKAFRQNKTLEIIWTAINKSPWCDGCQNGRYPAILFDAVFGASGGRGQPNPLPLPPPINQGQHSWDWSPQVYAGATALINAAGSTASALDAVDGLR